MTTNPASSSLQDLNTSNNVTNGGSRFDVNNSNNNVSYRPHTHNTQNSYQHNHLNEYRKSMPNLQEFNAAAWNSSMNDMEYHQSYYNNASTASTTTQYYGNMATTSSRSEMHLHAPKPYQAPASSSSSSSQEHQHLHRNSLNSLPTPNNSSNSNIYGNMTRQALMQISAVPKPKLTNDWVQYRKSEPVKPSLNSHWLIQEAEQRRIEQMNNVRSNAGSCISNKKPLPESIIQTITQRVVDLGIGTNVNKR